MSEVRIEGLQIYLEWTVSQIFFENFANTIKKLFFVIQNVVAVIFSYIYREQCMESVQSLL